NQVSRQDAQSAAGEEASKMERATPRITRRGRPVSNWREELAADQVTAEDEEEIDADPAEAVDAAGRFETEKGGVINDDDDDGEGAEKVEPGLALAIREARID